MLSRASCASTARTCFFLTGTDEHGQKMLADGRAGEVSAARIRRPELRGFRRWSSG